MKSAKVVFGAFCARLAVSSAALGLAAALAIHATPARADADYPNQQIRIFSGLAAGGGADITGLMLQGVPVAGLTPDSQRYFDYHHSVTDTIDKVNPRELHLGAAALASLIWLVDTQGL